MAATTERIQSILEELGDDGSLQEDEAARRQALASARSLVKALERPEEVMMHYAFEV